ncbi:molybdopterin-guanine dinucleotide biosynthesis protein B [Clostridium magnum]|uniref:Molybdopterin-guanine dinucleotide biosynthesis adapter protein n=1 Tax=Clostridium magnum DSM 2767 TaxID=1121326 RepID=A0A161WGB6_9CLOT|nr:molybdopterin-guanine dinucleotide biosynthesis protein B [Clostridium magnum]KZL90735.1 molybdopterin-guanine dinucleotide biosynthesis adapter protein [Clostridium magnum DSM 2767]SHI42506.1 molybdopterin-guanine dinucleotide biosynthesis protein B [Clostridium magnum DSM 2767]
MENLYLNKKRKPVIVSIIATKSGMGKTTLVESLIKILKNRNYTVGILKYDVKKFEIDREGKDSYRFSQAGADNVIIASSRKLAMIQSLKEEKTIEEIVTLFGDLDLVLIEGFKNNIYPKIEVHRKEVDNNLLYKNPSYDISNIVAIASDEKLDVNIPVLNLNHTVSIADFIEDSVIKEE